MQNISATIVGNIYLFLARIWLGFSMIMGGQSVLRFFKSRELRDFFENWFGTGLGLPAPVLMAFLAKGTEFAGGILICLGLLTRPAAVMVGFVMAVATLIANVNYSGSGQLIRQDGSVTISCFLFACLLIFCGGGKFSLDFIWKASRKKRMKIL